MNKDKRKSDKIIKYRNLKRIARRKQRVQKSLLLWILNLLNIIFIRFVPFLFIRSWIKNNYFYLTFTIIMAILSFNSGNQTNNDQLKLNHQLEIALRNTRENLRLMKEEVSKLNSQKTKLEDSLTRLETDVNSWKNNYTELFNINQKNQLELKTLTQSEKKLKNDNYLAEKNNLKISNENSNIKNNLGELNYTLKKEKKKTQNYIQCLKTDIYNKCNIIKNLEEQGKKNSEDFKMLNKQKIQLVKQINDLTLVKTNLHNDITKLKKETTDLRKETTDLREKIFIKNETINDLKVTVNEKNMQINNQEITINILENTINKQDNELSQNLKEMQSKLEELDATVTNNEQQQKILRAMDWILKVITQKYG